MHLLVACPMQMSSRHFRPHHHHLVHAGLFRASPGHTAEPCAELPCSSKVIRCHCHWEDSRTASSYRSYSSQKLHGRLRGRHSCGRPLGSAVLPAQAKERHHCEANVHRHDDEAVARGQVYLLLCGGAPPLLRVVPLSYVSVQGAGWGTAGSGRNIIWGSCIRRETHA